jgi:prolyl oligopeptidase
VFTVSPGGGVRETGWRGATVPAAPARVATEIDAVAGDGTRVPVSIVRRAAAPLDGSLPVLLQTIGAYGFSSTPAYDAVPEAWLALGGVYAVAHVRGGGELGETWRAGGRGANKANTWNDLVAAAQTLVSKGYASPQRLGLYGPIASYLGGEAASVAIGRAIEMRPDLFRAAVVDAPAFDLLRAETTFTGQESVDEFGSTTTKDGFDALYAMSPYAHVAEHTRYPAVLLRSYAKSGIGDDWQAAKFAARLQASTANPAAALFDVATSRTKLRVDLYAFLLWQMGLNAPPQL